MTSTTVEEDVFGTTSQGEQVKRYKLHNKKCNIYVELITYGGVITVIKVPDRKGNLCDVNLGFETVKDYEDIPHNPYIGALVGRVANRIGKAKFNYHGKEYKLPANDGSTHLHGGDIGWSMAVWQGRVEGSSVILSLTSRDGDQGYPGTVKCDVTYDITDQGELRLQYKAITDKATPIDLTNHCYFNLAGEGNGTICDHVVQLYCDYYLPSDDKLVPTGEIAKVEGTPFDLRQATQIGNPMKKLPRGGYMHCFCVNGPTGRKKTARVTNPNNGIVLEVYTDQPGVVFYTADYVDLTNAKNGHSYSKHSGFCLETQSYPDAVNQENFPDPFLTPDSEYQHTVCYKFSTN